MIELEFVFDRYGIFLTILFGFIGLVSFIYALATIREKGHQLEFYLTLLLIVLSGIGVALSHNLLFIFILWEISTYAIWRAVGYYRGDKELAAASLAFIINFIAATLMLIGFVLLYLDNGTLNIEEITSINTTSAFLIVVGIFAKSATIPIHIWLMPAYEAIPCAIGAGMAGIAENLGVVLFFRLFTNNGALASDFFNLVAWLAIGSSLIAGGAALAANRLRNLLAYSTVSQIGFILLAFALGGTYGVVGGMLYILAHALAKAGLFCGVGLIEDWTGEDDLRRISCLLRLSPLFAVSMALLAGSIVGLFPMIGFFSKLFVIISTSTRNLYFAAGAILAAVLTLFYTIRFYHTIFFGEQCALVRFKLRKSSYTGIGTVFILGLISLLAGLLFYIPLNYLGAEGF